MQAEKVNKYEKKLKERDEKINDLRKENAWLIDKLNDKNEEIRELKNNLKRG